MRDKDSLLLTAKAAARAIRYINSQCPTPRSSEGLMAPAHAMGILQARAPNAELLVGCLPSPPEREMEVGVEGRGNKFYFHSRI